MSIFKQISSLFKKKQKEFVKAPVRSDARLMRTILKDHSALQERKDKILLRDGHKRFIFSDGFTCIALNQKNADRKHRNALC
jgi:hypothetical protein